MEKLNQSKSVLVEAESTSQSLTSETIKRRRFLGLGLLGVAGLTLPLNSRAAGSNPVEKFVSEVISADSDLFRQQTDSFEDKIKLIEEAWAKKDYRLVRALSNSIRNTGIQAQNELEDPGKPLLTASQYSSVATLPAAWKTWANGWKYYKVIGLEEKAGIKRSAEPVEVLLSFPIAQVIDLEREIRVAEVKDGMLSEVTSQVFNVVRRGSEKLCKLMFLADNQGSEKRNYLVFYGNPDAELPNYTTDMLVRGEDFKLEIENQYFTAYLSETSGQLERMILKREHGVELYAGGPGHGEHPGIDWAHDYVTENRFQKIRITYWDECPDFEVIRGPICTIVRRWGFPYSAVHPIYNPSRLNIDIEYRFYAGLPYFHKIGKMTSVKEFTSVALRDDEWVFTGQPFNVSLYMGADEKLKEGEISEADKFSVKGFGYYHKDTKDSFIALYLDHSAEVLPELLHTGHSLLYYNWHGTTWSRYPLQPNQVVPKGAIIKQKNAYVTLPFVVGETPAKIESLRKELLSPMTASVVSLTSVTAKANLRTLARRGEAQDSPISKKVLWEALNSCIDQQLYIADINIVELGYIYDLSVQNDGVVKVVMSMPHRGRPLSSFFIWGSSVVHRSISKTITGALTEVPGVRKVVVEQTWFPQWNSNRVSESGRIKLGI
jgi:metal-sulfur cluster biosynthetic enzyme